MVLLPESFEQFLPASGGPVRKLIAIFTGNCSELDHQNRRIMMMLYRVLEISLQLYNAETMEDVGDCAICLENYSVNRVVSRFDCGHAFHPQCRILWEMHSNLCPVCRQPDTSVRAVVRATDIEQMVTYEFSFNADE
uniref:RING-type domain-containing protein n=1 Tax=Trichuris muris TaxID=70415 RepID=A0A5S6QC93_TRIMR